jgi:hypothetical protein
MRKYSNTSDTSESLAGDRGGIRKHQIQIPKFKPKVHEGWCAAPSAAPPQSSFSARGSLWRPMGMTERMNK